MFQALIGRKKYEEEMSDEQSPEQKKGYSCNALYCKKRRFSIFLFDKTRTQSNVKCHILHEES